MAAILSAAGTLPPGVAAKPDPDTILASLVAGNQRFMSGQSASAHRGPDRRELASRSSQGDYAQATILSCADSRVPIELVFDTGIMDLFVIRIAGNVCHDNVAGTVEFGLSHVRTPLLVVLGHSDCGAVKAVAAELKGHGHPMPRNIPNLVAPIRPAVAKAMAHHPEAGDAALIPIAVEENVRQSIEQLFVLSPMVRDAVRHHEVKVVGGVYDLQTGNVSFLPDDHVDELLKAAEANPMRVDHPEATGGHREGPAATAQDHVHH